MEILKRNNVTVTGTGQQAMVFVHGFGCDQHMWRLVAPAFEDRYRVVLLDLVGAGKSDLAAYTPAWVWLPSPLEREQGGGARSRRVHRL